jgi:hypothetical protein
MNDYLCCNKAGTDLSSCHLCPLACTGITIGTGCPNPGDSPCSSDVYGTKSYSC